MLSLGNARKILGLESGKGYMVRVEKTAYGSDQRYNEGTGEKEKSQ